MTLKRDTERLSEESGYDIEEKYLEYKLRGRHRHVRESCEKFPYFTKQQVSL